MKPSTIKVYKYIDNADYTWGYISIDSADTSEDDINTVQARWPNCRFMRATRNKARWDYNHPPNTKVKRK